MPHHKYYFMFIALCSIASIGNLDTCGADDHSRLHPLDYALIESEPIENYVNFSDILANNIRFNPSSQDILVLLHIQKTGGTTFERHLVNDLNSSLPCICKEDKRKCSCPRPLNLADPKTVIESTWLISRFSTGWICGLHPDWSQLSDCLAKVPRKFLVTFLRHPVHRFISEFRHVKRGATWKASRNHCPDYGSKLCYKNQLNWSNVSLDEFLECPSNLAINRQTRMLASRETFDCNVYSAGKTMLESAIKNLERMAFFGLCEEQRMSQALFERSLKFKFDQDFKQSEDNKTSSFIEKLPKPTIERIMRVNYLDMSLYSYAVDLFNRRCRQIVGGNKCTIQSKVIRGVDHDETNQMFL